MSAIIQLQNLSKSYGSIHALKGLTAEISGNVIGLLGPNGAGKSTMLKCLLGLTPHDGDAKVLGLSTKSESFRIRDRVGYMPEMDSYLSGLTAVELCCFAAELSGLPRDEAMQRAHAALYYAGLEDKRYLKVEGYSTGLKQRVKLAQALVHDPELLFLDEPTNGLDPRSRDEMLDLIMDLPKKRGCSIIISTHLLPDVDRICDQVIIMQQGMLKFTGTIEELRSSGSGVNECTYEIEMRDPTDEFAKVLQKAGCEVEDRPGQRLIVTVPSGEDASLVMRQANTAGAQLRHLEVRKETLEEAFLRVVGTGLAQAPAAPSGERQV
ncbi:MAG: ABC transporter ATP-binding protein [Myxococcales bacterium]|nr:ABC transporter ATP-binding protein [Myxococcales bacterium]